MSPSQWRLFITALLGIFLLPPITQWLLQRLRMIRPNYRGDQIPVGFGICILFWSAPVLGFLLYHGAGNKRHLAAYLLGVCGFGMLGFMDDAFGSSKARGLRGHFMALFKEHSITTGLIKAIGGIAISFFITRVILTELPNAAILDCFIIALSANMLNLLDVRPGRAAAIYILLAMALIGIYYGDTSHFPALIWVLIPAVLVYERDRRGLVMLGDCGANLLGGTLGIAFVLEGCSLGMRITVLILLIVFHLLTEHFSLTRLIEANSILRYLDRLTGVRSPDTPRRLP